MNLTETLLTDNGQGQEGANGFWSPRAAFCIEKALIALTVSALTGVKDHDHVEQIKLAQQTANPDA
ncbi:hypothetical protein HKX54_05015 [Sulfitobacter sp. M57]|uniref:hypothetical protein n=1 Tax=unclassified Sulfitobacter TaxID=196795 RepID=UPI0023E16B2A|nr:MULTISPECIES: hypothetical protein [unclassified Sulfitobacter]MDF3413809.1 hypothetical protein [Sulfitobacter sp. KE5]MDF3420910.1 hypothetical protein [Sulfitobacter sp. KE43]MDF3432355.1 hypothetical protein [Sulfitobacter sp. KE42]MDF3457994.1 hypothetical protein [Sulfitobacter sp. S74]MDF3461895.1 hypothetical protein [Sulfitobacter sp. Ks18]